MLIKQIIEFQLRGPGPPGRTYIPITDYFHNKTKILKENFRADYYFTAKILQEAMCLTYPHTWTKSLTIKIFHHNARF